jgi:single-strand DNA-binding protein
MPSDNTVTLVGNVTDDPELRFTPTGQAVVSFTVAVNRRFQKDGQWEDRLDGFFRCSAWRDMAENIAETLQRGTRVVVVGRLQQRSWEDSEGNKRTAIDIQVDDVGPSLRWATAAVTKSRRSGSSAGGGQGGAQGGGGQPSGGPPKGGDDWARSAPAGTPAYEDGGF